VYLLETSKQTLIPPTKLQIRKWNKSQVHLKPQDLLQVQKVQRPQVLVQVL
jgi:hypothetical protein